MKLMARVMTPAMARGALRDVQTSEDPEANLNDTYSLPSESFLKHMRLQIYQITHHVVVLWLRSCDQWHSIHDAATKKRLGVFHHAVTGEKYGTALTLGQSFSIIKYAKTGTKADVVVAGLTSTLVENEPVSATLKTCRSFTSGNAALSVSKELRERAKQEWEGSPEWAGMSPEQQESALDVYVLTCLNHSIALLSTVFFCERNDAAELESRVRAMISSERYHPLPVFNVPAAQTRARARVLTRFEESWTSRTTSRRGRCKRNLMRW